MHQQSLNHSASVFFLRQDHHRIAFIILVTFMLFVISVPKYDITAIVLYGAIPLFLIIAGRLPILAIIRRILIVSPFIVIMAVANPFIDREPFATIAGVSISGGIVSAIVIIGKSMVAIAAVVVFSIEVPFHQICGILRGFRVPEVFVTQLMLLYRYSFLLVEEAQALQKARAMRSFGKKGMDLFTTAKLIGSLLLRTNDKAKRIYRSMVSRGFSGELVKQKHHPMAPYEYGVIGCAFLVFSFIRILF
ncbi:MAG: cobalt ECF transporter T component CbiQ [Chitinivibrionales bacterium]|nr:cobalt ECF transporter T component CbiQ [Chitinivibrionales bacterium]